MRTLAAATALLLASLAPRASRATGHGPVYGLATPTLGQGAWSIDVSAMYRLAGSVGDGNAQHAMVRPMLGYGVTEDVQLSISAPMTIYTPSTPTFGEARMMAMMPSNPDVELLLGWRFHRIGNNVGSRFESTAYVGFDYPTDAVRGQIQTTPGFVAGAVTGYASRSIYAWAGGLYRRYMTASGSGVDRTGDLVLYSLVFGYRPELFRKELPHPDWRIFVEAVGEYTARDRARGVTLENTGGHQIFVGPTLLGLYGPWGISGGPLFRVYSRVNGSRPADTLRVVVNYTHWF
jgi:hypothetical protein